MKPQQKCEVVRILQTQGSLVMMTGDGANDSYAIKQVTRTDRTSLPTSLYRSLSFSLLEGVILFLFL